jgi:cytochrome oxidase Cu insertion factor (SCO1/SenC/PrrC family)
MERRLKMKFHRVSTTLSILILAAMLAACGPAMVTPTQAPPVIPVATQNPPDTSAPTAPAASVAIALTATALPAKPDWFNIKMTDVRTGQTFSVNDFSGKVVLIQTMVEWCPSCNYQQVEVKKLSTMLGNPDDLVQISLDVDPNEDAASLKKYADTNGFDWHFAVVPLLVARALGNLYSAEYLNGPLDPMLIIDRSGKVYGLPYGLKSAGSLQLTLAPYLAAR